MQWKEIGKTNNNNIQLSSNPCNYYFTEVNGVEGGIVLFSHQLIPSAVTLKFVSNIDSSHNQTLICGEWKHMEGEIFKESFFPPSPGPWIRKEALHVYNHHMCEAGGGWHHAVIPSTHTFLSQGWIYLKRQRKHSECLPRCTLRESWKGSVVFQNNLPYSSAINSLDDSLGHPHSVPSRALLFCMHVLYSVSLHRLPV